MFRSKLSAAQSFEHAITQQNRIARPALGEFDYFHGHDSRLAVVGVAKPECLADVGIDARHVHDSLRFEGLVLEQAVNGHAPWLPFAIPQLGSECDAFQSASR